MKKKKTKCVKRWKKNKREQIRITVGPYNGHELFSIRSWYPNALGNYRPGIKGISLEVSHLPKVMAGLRKVLRLLNACE